MKTKYYRQYPVRQFEFYAEEGQTDYCVHIEEQEPGLVLVSTQHCGRSRADIWSRPDEAFFAGGFFEITSRVVRHYGGFSEIWNSRIGEKESW